ncbi:hypothetical protein GCM10010182_53690 [Actinomadura cremea]|nr:hypothetical protein GCM10010182_53690 [Actinomadura cremea]
MSNGIAITCPPKPLLTCPFVSCGLVVPRANFDDFSTNIERLGATITVTHGAFIDSVAFLTRLITLRHPRHAAILIRCTLVR